MGNEADIKSVFGGCLIYMIVGKGFQSKFIPWVCLCVFMALLASHLDGELDWNYWIIAIPIWIWKGLAILGALASTCAILRMPNFIDELIREGTTFKSMVICVVLYLMLLIFECLTVANLESDVEDRRPWVVVFVPLLLTSFASIPAVIWAFKHDINCELELFCSVNALQFIFIALRLDEYITWSWEIVLIPAWILLSISVLAMLFTIIMAVVVESKTDGSPRPSFRRTAIAFSSVIVPIVIALILLACKLNGKTLHSFSSVVSPLYFSFTALIVIPCMKKKSNQWWFDLKDLWHYMLTGEIISQPITHGEEEILSVSLKLTSPEHPEVEKVVGSGSDHDAETALVVSQPGNES